VHNKILGHTETKQAHAWENDACVKCDAPKPCDAPSGLKATANTRSVTLKFNPVQGAKGYTIYYAEGSGKLKTYKSTTYTSITVEGLKPNVEYRFSVASYKTVDGVKILGEKSSEVKAKTTILKVKNPSAEAVAANKVTFSWSAVEGVDGYTVYSSANGSSGWKKVAETKAGTCSVSITGQTPGKPVYLRVRAYCTVDGKQVQGSYSDKVRAVTVPAAPKPMLRSRRTRLRRAIAVRRGPTRRWWLRFSKARRPVRKPSAC
jgi:hypothetical protein